MKKLIVLLILISVSVWGKYPFSQKTEDEIITLSQDVDLMIEGEVVEVKQYYIHKDERRLLELEEINDDNLGKVRTYTKLSIKVTENFKDQENLLNNVIDIWVFGGIINFRGEKLFATVSHSAYPFLDKKDKMIMGIKNNSNSNSVVADIIDDFRDGYHFYKGTELQIPSSDKMIEDIEKGELKRAEKLVYMKRLKSIEENSDEFISLNELNFNMMEAELEKSKKILKKKDFIKKLKKSLRGRDE